MSSGNREANVFQSNKRKVMQLLLQATPILEQFELDPRVRSAQKRLEREKMYLLVVGEFSRGKSTFINAILGEPVLPSKVNPTTATINLIEGGPDRGMTIEYLDGSFEYVCVPEEKVNKFLESYVTVSNERATSVKQVHVTWPGILETSDFVIVDTPGVNDLSEAREAVTFNYLANADACIMLLDGSSPLMASESSFLRDRVMANDITRIVYVINRSDEIDESPYGPTSLRVKEYVSNSLRTQFPEIADAKIYCVSAKNALRARVKKEDSVWEQGFTEVQTEWMELMSELATKERLPQHIDRLRRIVVDGMKMATQRLELLRASSQELEQRREVVEEKLVRWQREVDSVSVFLTNAKAGLSQKIDAEATNQLERIRGKLTETASACREEEQFAMFKSDVNTSLRQFVEDMTEFVQGLQGNLAAELQQRFHQTVTEGEGLIPYHTQNTAIIPMNNRVVMKESPWLDDVTPIGEVQGQNVVLGGGLAAVMGAALLGPFGIVAAIAGSIAYAGWREEQRDKQWEQLRAELAKGVDREINKIRFQVKQNADNLARQIASTLDAAFKAMIHEKTQVLQASVDGKLVQILSDERAVTENRVRLTDGYRQLSEMVNQLEQLREEVSL